MAFASAIAAGALIGVPAAATASADDDILTASMTHSADALTAGCVSQFSSHLTRLTGSEGDPVRHPVLLVHGWLSTAVPGSPSDSDAGVDADADADADPEVESTGDAARTGADPVIADSPFTRQVSWTSDADRAGDTRSLQERLEAVVDADVFAFDYSSVAALWVGHTATSPALAGAIECLASLSGEPVDIIAHSMGGLALRYALGGIDTGTASHVGQVITVATPSEGSDAASLISVIGGVGETIFASGSMLARIAVPAVVGICNRELETDARVGCDIPPSMRTVVAIAGDGGRALQSGSVELATLPDWPAGVEVHAVAGDYRLALTSALIPAEAFEAMRSGAAALGIRLTPPIDQTVVAGDGIVGVDSAIADADTSFVARCAVDADLSTGAGVQQLQRTIAAFEGIPPLAGPCAHDRLFENEDVVDDILATLVNRRD